MDHNAFPFLLILLLMCMLASLPAAMSKPYNSHTHAHQYVYDTMPPGLTSLQRHSDSERMAEEPDFNLSSIDVHEKRDLHATLSFRKVITSDPLEKLSNWTTDNSKNICSWSGICCRKYSRRVVAIDLYCFNLEGTLSRSLGNLSLLRTLNLSGNSLTGRIPPEFGELKELQALQLWVNLIKGSIPKELGMLHNLQILDLSSNRLTGKIPLELGELEALRVLNVVHKVEDNRRKLTRPAIPSQNHSLAELSRQNPMLRVSTRNKGAIQNSMPRVSTRAKGMTKVCSKGRPIGLTTWCENTHKFLLSSATCLASCSLEEISRN